MEIEQKIVDELTKEINKEIIEHLADKIVKEIVTDIQDRCGLSDEFDQISLVRRKIIISDWKQIIIKNLTKKYNK